MMDLYIKLSVCVPRLIPGRGFYVQISSEITSEFLGATELHKIMQIDERASCWPAALLALGQLSSR